MARPSALARGEQVDDAEPEDDDGDQHLDQRESCRPLGAEADP
jgi:hypothetical protein